MKKSLFVLLAICALAFNQVHAGSIYGISADGSEDEFPIGDVRSIKIAPKKDGFKSYPTIKFKESSNPTNSDETTSRFIMAYPNPVKEYITISGVEADAKISVVNMQGVEVLKTQGAKVNVSNLAEGSYILVVEGEKMKFIKK